MWKFQDFSVIQILCEINLKESKRSKTVNFDILKALNFVNLVDFSNQKTAEIHKNKNSKPLNL